MTVIDSLGFEDEADANDWLDRCRKDEREREQATSDAFRVVNRAVHAYRIAAGDPYAREVTHGHAHEARLGFGGGDDVVDGRWRAAYALPEPRTQRGRRQMLAPQEQLAGVLSGRSPAHASEDLALRARLDLEQGRDRQAALQLSAAVDALEAELTEVEQEPQERGAPGSDRDRVRMAHDLATAALRGELDDAQASTLIELLDEIERPIRRRRHS